MMNRFRRAVARWLLPQKRQQQPQAAGYAPAGSFFGFQPRFKIEGLNRPGSNGPVSPAPPEG